MRQQQPSYKVISSNHTDDYNLTTQNWNIAKWLKSKGIDVDVLDGFDNIADVVTLLNMRDELWHRMNLSEQATWGAYWNIVYKKKYPLTKKFWKKFERIVMAIDLREEQIQKQRQYIKSLRH